MFEGLKQWLIGLFAVLGMAAGMPTVLAGVSSPPAPSTPQVVASHWPIGTKSPKPVVATPVSVVPVEPIVLPQPKPQPLPTPQPLPKPYKCLNLQYASEMPSSGFVCPCRYVMSADENIRACRPPVEY